MLHFKGVDDEKLLVSRRMMQCTIKIELMIVIIMITVILLLKIIIIMITIIVVMKGL